MPKTFRRLAARVAAAALAASAASSTAWAHHSAARYDLGRTVTVEGVVTRYQWANPHIYIFIDETTDAGETVSWEIEGQGASGMRREGWSEDMFRPGDVVTVTGNPTRDAGAHGLSPQSIKLADVTVYDTMSFMTHMLSAEAPDTAATGLDGVWQTLLNLEVLLPLYVQPEGAVALTEAGDAALASYDGPSMNPARDCIAMPAPFSMFVPAVKEIETDGDVMRIRSEYDGAERVIHLDAADHAGATPSLQGHSIGRWEGETLVIDTAAFAEHRIGNAMGVPSGAQKHLVERLTLNEDGAGLTYAFELSDPEFLAEPVTGEIAWAYRPDTEFAAPACDLESARRFTLE